MTDVITFQPEMSSQNGVGSWLDHPFSLTTFKDFSAKEKHERTSTLRSLTQLIRDTTAPSKAALPWLKLALFGGTRTARGSLRHDANMLSITGIEADYDGEQLSIADAVGTMTGAGIAGIVYASPSHTPGAPRFRVLCITSASLPPDQRDMLIARLNGLFGGIFAPESWTRSQAYYYGSVRNNPAHEVHLIDGTPIDLHEELDATAIGKSNASSALTDRLPVASALPLSLQGVISPRMSAYLAETADQDSEFSAGIQPPEWFDRLTTTAKNGVIRQCLDAIDNSVHDPRDRWRNVIFAAVDAFRRGASQAYNLVLDWSQRGAGWTGEAAVEQVWNSPGQRSGGVTIGTLLHLGRQGGADLSSYIAQAGNVTPGVTATPAISPITASAFTTAGARRLRHVFGHLLARSMVSLFAAKTKTGKTAWLVAACLALATGRDLLGQAVLGRPLRVLFLNGEEPRALLLMRFRAAMILHTVTEGQLAPHLMVLAAEDLAGLRFTRTINGAESVDPAGIAQLAALVACYDVVFLDSLTIFLGSSANTNETMAAVMLALNQLARQNDAAILVVHHLRKGAGLDVDGMDSVTGASALANHCRVLFGLVPMLEGEAPNLGVSPADAWRYVSLIGLGNNYAPPAAGRSWLEKVGMTVPGTAEPPDYPADDVVVAMRVATLTGPAALITDPMRHSALQAIHSGAGGVPLSDSTRAKDRAVLPVIAAALAPHPPALSPPQRGMVAKEVLADLLAKGWVRVDAGARIPRSNGNGSDARRGLVVEWDRTPWQATDELPGCATASTATSPHPVPVDEVLGASVPPLRGHRNVPLERDDIGLNRFLGFRDAGAI